MRDADFDEKAWDLEWWECPLFIIAYGSLLIVLFVLWAAEKCRRE